MIDDRQPAMRVNGRIAVTGKVLCGRDHILTLDALGKSDAKSRHVGRILTKTPDIDDRIGCVIVYVEHRGVNVPDTYRLRLTSRYDAHSAGIFRFAGRGDGHSPREVGRVFEPHSNAGLGVERHQKRDLC